MHQLGASPVASTDGALHAVAHTGAAGHGVASSYEKMCAEATELASFACQLSRKRRGCKPLSAVFIPASIFAAGRPSCR